MKQFDITGMSCAACAARVEKAVGAVEGVQSCAVNLLVNSLTVEGDVDGAAVIDAVTKAGYGAEEKGNEQKKTEKKADAATENIIKRLMVSVGILAVLMYFSMGHMMWGLPLPGWFDGNHVAIGLVQMILSAAVMIVNKRFFVSGIKAALNRAPNMDTLVSLGSGASFAWSVYALFMMTKAVQVGDSSAVEALMNEFYFESAAMILTLITVGKMLESRSKGKTTDALKSLMSLAPETALVERNGKETRIPAKDVIKGDIFFIKPGDGIPVDGIVIEGESAVNEAALTGESMPVDKTVGETVSAGTVNGYGYLKCEAVSVGEDTALSKIIKLVSDAAAGKAPVAKLADKVSGIFVPTVILISVITLVAWLFIGQTFDYALARAISVLVISCPCALGLATPVAVMVGSGIGAKNSILFKTAEALENAGKVKIVALDKTGTVTSGEPRVTDIVPFEGGNEEKLLSIAVSLEAKSEHPLAKAIMLYGEAVGIKPKTVSEFKALPGKGVEGVLEGKTIRGGNKKLTEENAEISDEASEILKMLSNEGKTPLIFTENEKPLGIIAAMDSVKEEAASSVSELRKMGIRVIMLTGDNEKTAEAIAKIAGIDEVVSGLMPEDKEKAVKKLASEGFVAMVGDGINDAPALTSAEVGIAIGAGTDVAIDAADVVLVGSRLSDVPAAIKLSRAVTVNIKENLFWAFLYNVIGIPLAAGCLSKLGITLTPMFGAAAMSLSSFCVVSNALRLNRVKIRNKNEENKENRITLTVSGMMCSHCEKRVETALTEMPEIFSAVADHKSGRVKVLLKEKADKAKIKATVNAAGYKITKIKE